MRGVFFKELSHEDMVGLKVPFTLQEVKEVIWNAASGKSLGPYGFSMEFFKASWEIILSFHTLKNIILNSIIRLKTKYIIVYQ